MRRVVITGIGIVSSIGNSAAEVEASSGGKVGHRLCPRLCRTRLPLPGAWPAEHRAGRPYRQARPALHGRRGGLYLHRDGSGGEGFRPVARGHLQRPHRHHRRLRRAVDQVVLQGPQHRPRNRLAQADRPLRRDQGHVLDRLGLPCDAVQDQGRELFHHLRLLHQRALHRQRRRTDPDGQAGHRLCRRRRGTGLDAVLPVRRDGRDVVQVQRHAGTRLAHL
jgi:hypothetical protein